MVSRFLVGASDQQTWLKTPLFLSQRVVAKTNLIWVRKWTKKDNQPLIICVR